MPKWVYQFNSSNCEGTLSQKPLLGGKGANLAEMGSYDEGWVRSPDDDSVKSIGKNRSQTKYQSNWLIFKK